MKTEFILFNQANGNSVNNKKVDNNFSKDNANFSDFMNRKVSFKAGQKDKTNYISNKDTNPIGNLKNSNKDLLAENEKVSKRKDLTSAELERIAIIFADISNSTSEDVALTLNISQEELEEILETLGFTSLDLLNKDNATKLFLLVNEDANLTNLITNEDLMSKYNSFIKLLEDIQENLSNDMLELIGIEDADAQAIIDELKANNQKMNFAKLFEDLMNKNESQSLQTDKSSINMQDQFIQIDDSSLSKQDNSEAFGSNQINSQKDSDSINFIVDNQKPKSNEQGSSTLDQANNGLWNNFSNNLNSTISNNKIFNSSDNLTSGIFDISNQIIEQIKVKLQPDQTSIEMKLYPEHLGKLAFQVSTKSGILTASFTTENEVTKEIIESQLHILKEQLNLQGLKVENVEVEVGISQFFTNDNGDSNSSRPKQNQGNKNRSNFWSHFEEDDPTSNVALDDLLISYDLDDVNRNTINYSA